MRADRARIFRTLRGAARIAVVALLAAGCADPAAPPRDTPPRFPGQYTELYRPQYHYTPRMNWMNDPNGPIYRDGVYHLFYQYNPSAITWGNMSWGHATSPDLVRWTEQPVALSHTDTTFIFSGSAVEDRNNTSGLCAAASCLVAIYTAFTQSPTTQLTRQAQHLAHSDDGGRTWTKYAGNPVLDIASAEFRDPYVFWHQPTRQWIMAVALAVDRKVQFYGSPDLKAWALLSEFGPAGATGGVWECPVLLPLPVDGDPRDVRWVLKVDLNPGHVAGGSGGQYFVGAFDGRTFSAAAPQPPGVRWVDYGMDFYCAIPWTDPPADGDGPPWIAWMADWLYALDLPTFPWRGAMTIPRDVGLRTYPDGVHLAQTPVEELRRLRGPRQRYTYAAGVLADVTELPAASAGQTLELEATLRPGRAGEVGILVRRGAREHTLVAYDVAAQQLVVDRRDAGNAGFNTRFTGRHAGPLPLRDGEVRLRIFVDRSSVEVFGDGGRTVITSRIFPDSSSTGVALFSKGGPIEGLTLDVWPLRSAW